MPANHKEELYPIYRETLYVHVCMYLTSSVHSRDSAALHFNHNHRGTTVENYMKQDTKLVMGEGLEGWAWKIKSNNGTEKWKHTKHQKTPATVA